MTSNVKWHDRIGKTPSRDYALEGVAKAKGACLFLPGWDDSAQQSGQCVRRALARKIITRRTKLYLIERDSHLAALIEKDMRKLGFTNIVMHVGELVDLKITDPIYFAFIDLMGSLSYSLCNWIREELAPRLTENAVISVTLQRNFRNNSDMHNLVPNCLKLYHQNTREIADRYEVRDKERVLPFFLFQSSFDKFDFDTQKPFEYRDSAPMMVFRFSNFRKKGEIIPTLEELFDIKPQEEKPMKTQTKSKTKKPITVETPPPVSAEVMARRSAAAFKAHATRRANAAILEQQMQDRAAVRSAAARKAHETRRANGWVHPSSRARRHPEGFCFGAKQKPSTF